MPGFDDLYRDSYAAVALVAGSITGSWAEGEEVAQEAFTRVHQDWKRVQALDKPGAWTRRIAINMALNRRRSADREQRAVEQLAQSPAGEPPTARDMTLWQAVGQLAPKQRATVVLRYHDGYSTAEIAEILDTTVTAVTTSLHKARARLAATIGDTP